MGKKKQSNCLISRLVVTPKVYIIGGDKGRIYSSLLLLQILCIV
jgi:hypothetical protein